MACHQKPTEVERCPLVLSVPQPNLQELAHPSGRFSFTKIVDRPNILASTVCNLFAGETRTKTTLTKDVASSPDTLLACDNQARPVQWVEELRHKMGRSGFHFRYDPWKFSTDLILLSACSRPAVKVNQSRYRPGVAQRVPGS